VVVYLEHYGSPLNASFFQPAGELYGELLEELVQLAKLGEADAPVHVNANRLALL
jgi:hypothetical protein